MTAPPRQVISVAVQWDPAPIPAGKTATRLVAVHGATVGDVATASHEGAGMELVGLFANAAGPGQVLVILRNLGEGAVDVPPGMLRVAITKFGMM